MYSIDMEGVLSGSRPFWEAFVAAVNKRLSNTKVDHRNILDLEMLFAASSKKTYFDNSLVFLIMDEIQSISLLDITTRAKFLGSIRSIKQDRQSSCLHSSMIITNWVGKYLYETISGSPFNITTPVPASYFTRAEVVDNLILQYEQQEDIAVDEHIKDHIFKLSEGAQGTTTILCAYYDLIRQRLKKCPSYQEWINATSFRDEQFWTFVQCTINLQRMEMALQDPAAQNQLILWMADSTQEITPSIKNDLVKANIIKMPDPSKKDSKIAIASNFVERYIRSILTERRLSPMQVPIISGKQVDFFELVCAVVKNMDRKAINDSPKKKNCTDQSKNAVLGPKEIVYASEFNATLKLLLADLDLR
jgi:hypothetical protein